VHERVCMCVCAWACV